MSPLTAAGKPSGFQGSPPSLQRDGFQSHSFVFLWMFIGFFGVAALGIATVHRPSRQNQEPIVLGNEFFCREYPAELGDKKLGLVINQTSFLAGGDFLAGRLIEANKTISAIFTPEHGLMGTVEAGVDVKTVKWNDIPVYSLYGEHRKPVAAQLKDVDALVYDIQDVGARFYTYVSTLKGVLEAAAEANIPIYVLDRPNPAGGEIIEGPILDPAYSSFIAPLPIPTRYGLTIGELALMMKDQGWVPRNVDLTIIKMAGWQRNMNWDETGIPWIPTSPNIPTPQTAHLYSGTGLFGALNINEGRGTRSPFLAFGAPWMNAEAVVKDIANNYAFPVSLEVLSYAPESIPGKASTPLYLNKRCQGVKIKILNERELSSVRFALAVMKSIKDHNSSDLVIDRKYLAQMFGTDSLFLFLTGQKDWTNLIGEMERDEKVFRGKRFPYLLY